MGDGLLGPDSIIVVYMDLRGLQPQAPPIRNPNLLKPTPKTFVLGFSIYGHSASGLGFRV